MVLNHIQEHWEIDTPEELIHRYRREVLVHSILYYQMGEPILTDLEFDRRAKLLAQLQKDHPAASSRVLYHYEGFKDFTGETGYHLPLADYRAILTARRLWTLYNLHRRSQS